MRGSGKYPEPRKGRKAMARGPEYRRAQKAADSRGLRRETKRALRPLNHK